MLNYMENKLFSRVTAAQNVIACSSHPDEEWDVEGEARGGGGGEMIALAMLFLSTDLKSLLW